MHPQFSWENLLLQANKLGGIPGRETNLLIEAALEAGKIGLSYFGKDPQVFLKEGGSPVTEADLAINTYLEKILRDSMPDYGWLSEETEDNHIRLEQQTVLIIDPIDGTRAFMEGRDEWCVSIGLVTGGRPVAGVLYVPVRQELIWAEKDKGAWCNGKRLEIRKHKSLRGLSFAIPRGLQKSGLVEKLGATSLPPVRSLAYRLAMVALNTAAGSISGKNAHDWDIAAADLIVEESGGRLINLQGEMVQYNKPDLRHPALIAAGDLLAENIRSVLLDTNLARHL
ncbi:MAG: 3'(2'),5'-bisphosphate nucleotidase CysQ [Hyphomicrobiales bacterium]|nr:MAG: 3'(2'),5'-bisphosphate nucleotidase CysQ [Hyphomicrobiales bacterium]